MKDEVYIVITALSESNMMHHSELDLNIIIPLPGIQFVLHTHKHVLNEITGKTCSNPDNKD